MSSVKPSKRLLIKKALSGNPQYLYHHRTHLQVIASSFQRIVNFNVLKRGKTGTSYEIRRSKSILFSFLPASVCAKNASPTQFSPLITTGAAEINKKGWRKFQKQTFRYTIPSNSGTYMPLITAPSDFMTGHLVAVAYCLITYQRM